MKTTSDFYKSALAGDEEAYKEFNERKKKEFSLDQLIRSLELVSSNNSLSALEQLNENGDAPLNFLQQLKIFCESDINLQACPFDLLRQLCFLVPYYKQFIPDTVFTKFKETLIQLSSGSVHNDAGMMLYAITAKIIMMHF